MNIDLDVLRGWAGRRDAGLAAPHRLPVLLELTSLGADGTRRVEQIFGPDVLFGRYHPQYGPVDVIPPSLDDHENYRLGAPHAQLRREAESWVVRALSPSTHTAINGKRVSRTDQSYPLADGDTLQLGHVAFSVSVPDVEADQWREARRAVLAQAQKPALFLKRAGGPCGPFVELDRHRTFRIGRSFPRPGEVVGSGAWDDRPQPDWDLEGLPDHERKFVAFDHVELCCGEMGWSVRPRSRRQRTFVNRIEIAEETPLMPGDELALGPVALLYYEPDRDISHEVFEPPAVVDWQEEGSAPIVDEEEPR